MKESAKQATDIRELKGGLKISRLNYQNSGARGKHSPLALQFFKFDAGGFLPGNQHQPASRPDARTVKAHNFTQLTAHPIANHGATNSPRCDKSNFRNRRGLHYTQDHKPPMKRGAFPL
jgi:hypothetical protein